MLCDFSRIRELELTRINMYLEVNELYAVFDDKSCN